MDIDGKVYQIAHFREHAPTDQCELLFQIDTEVPNVGKVSEEIKAVRQVTDTVVSLLQHIKNKILKILQDKYNNKDEGIEPVKDDLEIPVSLTREGRPVKPGMVLKNFPLIIWKDGCLCVIFTVFNVEYIVLLNAPLVKQIKLSPVLYANYSIQPIKFHTIFTENQLSDFIWYRSLDKVAWEEIGSGFHYKIKEDDVGHYLKFVCLPRNQSGLYGPQGEVVSDVLVERMGDLPTCPFERRHEFTNTKLAGHEFRVVTYNILAEKYTIIDENYNYCEPKFLAIDYRKQLISRELLGYKADIICLQEVDNRHYSTYFKENFKQVGYHSFYHRKGNRLPEGLAIFFDKARFKSVESKQIVFSNEIQNRRCYSYLWDLLRKDADLQNVFLKQSTSLQVTVLKAKEENINRHIIVANTHLYYHPDANHIRLLQVHIATSYLTFLKKKYMRNGAEVTVIFCGDFNSSAQKSLYPFMLQGTISPEHPDCLKLNENGRALLHHEFIFESASGTPKYTNYTPDYKGCLDYIFIESNKLAVTQVVPLTDEEELAKHEGLPNAFFPSDHLALVVDLKFKY